MSFEEPGAQSPERSLVPGSNQKGLRDHNERLILTTLRTNGPTAKAEIARMTGLSAQTASVIMRGLEREGLIERCEPVRGKVGQPLIPMRLASEGALFFGLKVGRRSADLVLVDFLGRIIAREHPTYRYPTPDGTVRFAVEAVGRMIGGLSARRRQRIAGLGVAIPFYLWEWAKIIGEPPEKMAAWRDRDIRAELAELFDFPVYLGNDASCACGAELVFGGQDHPPDFLYVFVGYFIGGGLVLGNRLFTGPTGNAGALGPLPVPTGDGRRQDLVDLVSLSGLEKMVLERGGDASALWQTPSIWRVDRATLDAWLDQAAYGLAYAIISACSFIDFTMVMIDGWLPRNVRRDLVDRTASKLNEMAMPGLARPELREGSIGPNARSLGAASLPLSQRFLVTQSAY